mgnify:CR=1 FL=1
MSTPQIATVDCATGVQTVRDMTAEEVAAQEAFNAEVTERQAADEAAATKLAEDKASGDAKLKALGLTDDEIAAR